MKVVQPPTAPRGPRPWLFLAGSIEMGVASRWQDAVIDGLEDRSGTILNPRRSAWDSSWKQSIDNPVFREQVEWELASLEAADQVAMYFDPTTRAPITLLELGLVAASGKLVVACPDGYWRRGNVQVVCDRYRVPLLPDLPALQTWLRRS